MPVDISLVKPHTSGESAEFVDILWPAFTKNLDTFKSGKVTLKDEIKFTILSAPGPAQYNAFNRFLGFIKGGETQIEGLKGNMYAHDFLDMDQNENIKPAIVELLENVRDKYDVKGKNIVFASGSFWGRHPATRKKIIDLLKELKEKGATLQVVTQAQKDEDKYIDEFASHLDNNSRFNIPSRILIHFLQIGDDFIYVEFPHTESTEFRLNILLDLNSLKYKGWKKKNHLLKFLAKLIRQAQ